MYLQDINDEKRHWREQANNELIFRRELLKPNRRQHKIVDVKHSLKVRRHFFELKHIDKQQNQHRVDDHNQMKYEESFAPKCIVELF